MLIKKFLGIDLKIGGQIVLWIHLVENFLLLFIIVFRSRMMLSSTPNDEFILIASGYRIGQLNLF